MASLPPTKSSAPQLTKIINCTHQLKRELPNGTAPGPAALGVQSQDCAAARDRARWEDNASRRETWKGTKLRAALQTGSCLLRDTEAWQTTASLQRLETSSLTGSENTALPLHLQLSFLTTLLHTLVFSSGSSHSKRLPEATQTLQERGCGLKPCLRWLT